MAENTTFVAFFNISIYRTKLGKPKETHCVSRYPHNKVRGGNGRLRALEKSYIVYEEEDEAMYVDDVL